MSSESHICTKKQCFYCYEMKRLKMDKPIYTWPKTEKQPAIKIEKEEVVIIEMYDHVLKKSKTVIPQVKPLTVKTMYSTFRLINTK